jgi:broad specificity phosphatase PhoE
MKIKPPLRFLLVRHGLSAANVDATLYEQLPDAKIPLTEKGWKQAEGAGKFLKYFLTLQPTPRAYPRSKWARLTSWLSQKPYAPEGICLFTSSYLRARQTAQGVFNAIAHLNPQVSEYDWLVEQDFGIAQGFNSDSQALHAAFPDYAPQLKQAREHSAVHWSPKPGGESRANVTFRAQSILQSAFREYAENGRTNFVIVTHSVTLRQIVKALLKLPYEISDKDRGPGNCDIRLLERPADGEKFMDYGYIWQNGQAKPPQPPRPYTRCTTPEMFANNAYRWEQPKV